MFRRKISSALVLSLLAGLAALQAPSASPVSANGVTTGWQAVGGGIAGAPGDKVFSLLLGGDGYLYAGGSFNLGLARVSVSAGSGWSGLAGGVGGGSYPDVYALGLDTSVTPNQLYVGGSFTTYGMGVASSPRIAKVELSNTPSFSPVGTGYASSGLAYDGVEEIAVINGSRIFFGGTPATASAIANTEGVAKWDGSTISAITSGFGGDKRVNGLASQGGLLYVGGQFNSVTPIAGGTVTGSAIAVFNPTTSAWTSLGGADSGPGTSGLVAAIAVKDSNNVFVGGVFNSVSNSASAVPNTKHLAKWDGTTWSSIGSVTGGVIEELRIVGQYLYAGGEFTAINGVTANNIARMELSTGIWEPLVQACFNGVNGVVRSIIDAGDGVSVFVGGGFTDVAGIGDADRVAKFTPGATAPCPTGNVETMPVLAFDGPPNFKVLYGGMLGTNPNYNNGQKGKVIGFTWGKSSKVDYYIYKVSAVEVTDWESTPIKTRPLDSSYDCWSIGLTCEIIISNEDKYYSARTLAFEVRGFAFDGVGKATLGTLPGPYDPVYPPDPPTDVTAVAGWRSVTVSWKAPVNTGTYPITNYLVTSTPGNRTCITTLADLKFTQCTFTSLTPGTNYTFKVQALAAYLGWGQKSEASTTPVSPQTIDITKFTRNRVRFLFVNRGSDVEVGGVAPGYPAGTTLKVWVRYGDSTQWQPLGDVKVSRFGTFSWKRRFPTNQDRTPISITFTEGNNQAKEVKLAPVR